MGNGNRKPKASPNGHPLDPSRLAHVEKAFARHKANTIPSEQSKRRAAVAMILREGPSGGLEALFIQRAEFKGDPWSGHMAFPGGGQDEGDATLEAAACRETLEEVGVDLTDASQLGRLHDLSGGRLSMHSLTVSPFVFHHPVPPAVTPNHEVADTVWIPLAFMANPANVSPYHHSLDPKNREFPAFEYKGYTIWGLTFRILANFFALFNVELPREPLITDIE